MIFFGFFVIGFFDFICRGFFVDIKYVIKVVFCYRLFFIVGMIRVDLRRIGLLIRV